MSTSDKYRTSTIVYAVILAVCLSVLFFLNVSDWYAQYQAEKSISRFEQIYDNSPENEATRLWYRGQAESYNDALAGKSAWSADILPYQEQLFYLEEPMMSFIEIPQISVRLPIYHGTEENALMAGLGHLETSSLPVGGEDSHCVLFGHSGMRNTRMLDDLDRLSVGDKFVIRSLNDPYAYEVYEKETVLPEELESMTGIQPGQDLVTLVTCVPQGVNTHRLLVHAKRCEYHEGDLEPVGMSAYVNSRNWPLVICLVLGCMVALASTIVVISSKRRSSGKRKEARTEDASRNEQQ